MRTVKMLRIAAGILVLLAAVYGLGRLFVAQLRVASAPAGYLVEQRGEIRRDRAARELAGLLAARPTEGKLALHFTSSGAELYWLVDRLDGRATTLTELAAAPSGTRVETTWRGTMAELEGRLAWAAAHGTLAAPALQAGESHNLYH